MYGIKIKTRKAEGEYDKGCSKMLGNPTLPEGMLDTLPATAIFLMQIRLEDIKDLDKENLLPHKGYLYFFLDVEDGEYSMKPIVKYYEGEPTEIVDEFNAAVDGYEKFCEDYIIEFEKCDESETGNKLLGCPGDWQFAEEPGQLLFQLDPYEEPMMEMFPTFDGMMYFFFGEDRRNFDEVKFVEDFS